ncbi:MAG: hypothetical protein MJK11_09610 [Pseudomonadales bacterium]|nr:hypothetical protein [Pseudomonadales bacterium]
MYSIRFKIKFIEEVPHIDRMKLMCELLELPQKNGIKAENLYWYKIKHDGLVTFWSATYELTKIIETWLIEKIKVEYLICIKPKLILGIDGTL